MRALPIIFLVVMDGRDKKWRRSKYFAEVMRLKGADDGCIFHQVANKLRPDSRGKRRADFLNQMAAENRCSKSRIQIFIDG